MNVDPATKPLPCPIDKPCPTCQRTYRGQSWQRPEPGYYGYAEEQVSCRLQKMVNAIEEVRQMVHHLTDDLVVRAGDDFGMTLKSYAEMEKEADAEIRAEKAAEVQEAKDGAFTPHFGEELIPHPKRINPMNISDEESQKTAFQSGYECGYEEGSNETHEDDNQTLDLTGIVDPKLIKNLTDAVRHIGFEAQPTIHILAPSGHEDGGGFEIRFGIFCEHRLLQFAERLLEAAKNLGSDDSIIKDRPSPIYIQGVLDALRASVSELHSHGYNQKRAKILELVDDGDSSAAFKLWQTSPVMQEKGFPQPQKD